MTEMATKQAIRHKQYAVWIPLRLHTLIEALLEQKPELDRSKLIRRALRNELRRMKAMERAAALDDAQAWFEDFARGEADE